MVVLCKLHQILWLKHRLYGTKKLTFKLYLQELMAVHTSSPAQQYRKSVTKRNTNRKLNCSGSEWSRRYGPFTDTTIDSRGQNLAPCECFGRQCMPACERTATTTNTSFHIARSLAYAFLMATISLASLFRLHSVTSRPTRSNTAK